MASSYFWRTVSKQEIDYVEENAGKLAAFEFKWNPKAKAKAKFSKKFLETYKATATVIHRDNFRDFIG